MKQIEICIYNLENFFIRDAFDNPPNINYFKSKLNLNQLKQVFTEIDADIYALTEVGQVESLVYFNEVYLNESYEIFHQQGNSDRGIENAFLVRKGLEFEFEHLSHTNKEIDFQLHDEDDNDYFLSRDFSHLRVNSKKGEHLLSLFNVHLKSQRDDDTGHDFRSVRRRQAELELLLKVYKEEKKQYPSTPILLCGDFNGNASNENTDEEFKVIYKETDLKDVLSMRQLPLQYRTTFYQFVGQAAHQLQLDYIFMEESFGHRLMDAAVYQYKNSSGRLIGPPRRRGDIWNNPSDHYPVYAIIKIQD
ncbi:endonuclease/exonuclease/phosphatase family protein [Halobacteriovorax sp.]|uniref:endonuclease/exonuclease/phosphatase family protein n=1 Tax=Halobacteriovorax sp. TaxID=2020862 RepID=UPI003AF20A35